MADAAEEERKREALRKAGQEYFERVLAEASTGKDPFAAEPIEDKAAKRAEKQQKEQKRAQRRQRLQNEDPDMEAVGAVISGARLYILTAVFVSCTGMGLLFMKVAFPDASDLRPVQRSLKSVPTVHFPSPRGHCRRCPSPH